MTRKHTLFILAIILPIAAALLLLKTGSAATTPQMGCLPLNLTVKTGQTFYFTMAITDVTDLYGWQFDVTYNTTYLEFLRMVPGNFLASDETNYWFVRPTASTGAVRLAAQTRLSKDVGMDGSGALAHIFFRAVKKTNPSTSATLANTDLVNRYALDISRTFSNSGRCVVVISDSADDLIQPPVGEVSFVPQVLR